VSGVLPTRAVEKPWGMDVLPAPFAAPDGTRIGEIWFEPPAALPDLLVKYIFTSEKLSVQVHPDDAQTLAAGLGRQGKEECWLVIDAQPGAALGIGFDQALDRAAMHQAALDGSIERLMTWHPVQAGDFFYIPAGTVHAIGAGVSLIEVQQNSDITYRLFDYGRPRELHLEEGLGVALGQVYDMAGFRRVAQDKAAMLVDGPLFRLDQVVGAPDAVVAARYGNQPVLVIPRSGAAAVGGAAVNVGECALASSLAEVIMSADAVCLITQPVNLSAMSNG
jgi:mannose-6-phosphate isomerase